jgi:hypothetical protein
MRMCSDSLSVHVISTSTGTQPIHEHGFNERLRLQPANPNNERFKELLQVLARVLVDQSPGRIEKRRS